MPLIPESEKWWICSHCGNGRSDTSRETGRCGRCDRKTERERFFETREESDDARD